jgi:HK97 family phage prohead protease
VTITRNAPTAQDATVTQNIGTALVASAAAVAAQSKDPDNNTDPADKKVMAQLVVAHDALSLAAQLQAKDGAPDKEKPEPEDANDTEPADGSSTGEDPGASDENAADGNRSRDPVIRQVEFRAVPGGDGNTLEGYAAVFDDPALIEDWAGEFTETVQRGAFAKTISERKPVLMFDHGQHPMVGSIPIGTITQLREDPKGLYVQAKLADNWLVQPVRDAIAGGAITGMSIRMSVLQDKWTKSKGKPDIRSISEIALHELGPVVFPAYENTQVSVRSREVITALADPKVRAEVARFAASTDARSAATDDESARSARIAQIQRRARVALSES